MLKTDAAKDLGISAGDTITVTFQETGEVQLPVLGVYENSGVVGNWLIDQNTYSRATSPTRPTSSSQPSRRRTSVPDDARATIEQAIEPYPQLKAQDRDEFQAAQEAQLNGVAHRHRRVPAARHRHRDRSAS